MIMAKKMMKRGRHYPPMPFEDFLDEDLKKRNNALLADGYTHPAKVKAYLRTDGYVSVRLVWRKRSKPLSITFTESFQIDMRETVQSAIDKGYS
jgi:hypothetical protein